MPVIVGILVIAVMIALISLSGCIDSLSQVNSPPQRPVIPHCRQIFGYVGESYTFYTFTIDPDGPSDMEFYWEWGDGKNTGWIPDAKASHLWASPGYYDVRVKARDEQGAESEWSIDCDGDPSSSCGFKIKEKDDIDPNQPQNNPGFTKWQSDPYIDEPDETPGFELILFIFSFLIIVMILSFRKEK